MENGRRGGTKPPPTDGLPSSLKPRRAQRDLQTMPRGRITMRVDPHAGPPEQRPRQQVQHLEGIVGLERVAPRTQTDGQIGPDVHAKRPVDAPPPGAQGRDPQRIRPQRQL